jgi:predicted HTH transcriptional regulator
MTIEELTTNVENALQEIRPFLNSDGGDLLVGVDDDGKVTGIENEIDKLHRNSRDKFLKHFKNVLKERIV